MSTNAGRKPHCGTRNCKRTFGVAILTLAALLILLSPVNEKVLAKKTA